MAKKMNENAPLIIAGLLGLVGVFLGLKKGYISIGQNEQNLTDTPEQDQIEIALLKVRDLYGSQFAKQIEQSLRIETAHFTSGQWKRGKTAGMEATNNTWPFGWTSLNEFVNTTNIAQPNEFTIYEMIENQTGRKKVFLKFPDAYTFILFFAWFIQNKRNGRVANWYSLNENSAQSYENLMANVVPRIVNSFA